MVVGASFFSATCLIAIVGYMSAGWKMLDAIYMVVITVFGVGYGETKPICKEHNEGCWSKNRRVEFIIEKTSGQGGAKFQGGEGQ